MLNDFLFLCDFDENIVCSYEWLINVNFKIFLKIFISFLKKKYNDDYFVMILYFLWILSLN